MIAIAVILILLFIGISYSERAKQHSDAENRMVNEAIRHHLASYLRQQTGKGPWLEMDDFYRLHSFDMKCTACSKDTIFVCNDNPSRETECIDVHFNKGKLTVFHGKQSLFDGDPLYLMAYPEETFPLKRDNPPPKESGTNYSVWVEYFKKSERIPQGGEGSSKSDSSRDAAKKTAEYPSREVKGEGLHTGMPRDEAVLYFQLNANRPVTSFGTDDWLLPSLAELERLLSDPITQDQGSALGLVLRGVYPIKDLIDWLQSGSTALIDFFSYRENRERDAAWERWKRQNDEDMLSGEFPSRPERCPKCGSDSVLEIAYGFPTPETQEAARRGAIALGGCMRSEEQFCCVDCEYRWPEDDIDDARENP